MLERKPEQFADTRFDVLIIGGGINGLGIAWDCALRGLKTGLVEKSEFGTGATAGCFGIVHGGLRYLQHLDFPRLRRSVLEQRTLRRIAPGLVKPLPVLVPCYGRGKKSAEFLRLGLSLYEFLARDKNSGVAPEYRLPRYEVLSNAEVLERAPGIYTPGLRGGIIFYDAQMESVERLTRAVANSAAATGAALGTKLELVGAEPPKGADWLLKIRDAADGGEFFTRARAVVNAGGPWGADVLRRLGVSAPVERDYVRGLQLVFPPIVSTCGVSVESREFDLASVINRGGRSFFLLPSGGVTLAGTYETPQERGRTLFAPTEEEIERFVSELARSYGDSRLKRENVLGAFGGLIPLVKGSPTEPGKYRVERDDEITILSSSPVLVHVTGVKYTTFRALSERVTDLLVRRLGVISAPCTTGTTRLSAIRCEK